MKYNLSPRIYILSPRNRLLKEYASILGNKFYDLSNDEKASRFFHIALDADKKDLEKGA